MGDKYIKPDGAGTFMVKRASNDTLCAVFETESDARLFVKAERAMDLIQEIALSGGDRAKKARAILRDEVQGEVSDE